MIDLLLGVPGKLKALSDYITTYWTAVRAAKLDYLTGNVAVASTAVSNVDYTSGRAAKLDLISSESPITRAPISMPVNSSHEVNGYISMGGMTPGLVTATLSTTLIDVVNVTGAGVLEVAVASAGTNVGSGVELIVTIDGTVFYSQSEATNTGGSWAVILVAAGCVSSTFDSNGSKNVYAISGYSQIPFKTSLRIQARYMGTLSEQTMVRTRYRRVA